MSPIQLMKIALEFTRVSDEEKKELFMSIEDIQDCLHVYAIICIGEENIKNGFVHGSKDYDDAIDFLSYKSKIYQHYDTFLKFYPIFDMGYLYTVIMAKPHFVDYILNGIGFLTYKSPFLLEAWL